MKSSIQRRDFFAMACAFVPEAPDQPAVPESLCPVEKIQPISRDGHKGMGFLRKPPNSMRMPAVVIIHGTLREKPADQLREHTLSATPTRFLKAGYVIADITYRSRDDDPQSRVSFEDCLAAVEYVRKLPYVDPSSMVVYGCSGGGDLALELAAATELCALVPEEPASMMFTGVFNGKTPKKGKSFAASDTSEMLANPKPFFTAEYRKSTREKIARIRCPLLIVQGDQHVVNRFNAEILIPELRSAGKKLEVITYPGQNHCFGFGGREESGKMFRDVHAFLRKHVPTRPKEMAN
ncbi:MAG: prolyl oligopeptidase family serine peptidase [Candidatus Solibacter usitatus]|nr:prolyl oligopeptidase family serine peptidase [Candidatus Solibacter usitatus]